MALSTIYLYKELFPSTTSTNSQISFAINTASSYIEQYLDRDLEYNEYTEVLDVHDGLTQLTEYPVIRIKNVLTDYNDTVLIQTDSNLFSTVLSANNTSLTITTTNNSDVDTDTILNYSSYANLASLTSAIDNISGITASIQAIHENTPSKYLTPINKIVGNNGQIYLYSWVRDSNDSVSYYVDPVTNRNLYIDNYCRKYVYVNYTAGYIAPVDNNDNTALSISGNVPVVITDVCNKLSSIILQDIDNGMIKSGYCKSESIGDYSYTLSDVAKSSVESLINSYEDSLLKFKKTWLMG